MIWLWVLSLGVWWATGFIGMIISVASLRTALVMRQTVSSEIEQRYVELVLNSAVARLAIFVVPFFSAPVFISMFRIGSSTQFSNTVTTVLPFGVIALSMSTVAMVSSAILVFVLADLRSVLKQNGKT